jgi:hypothetical protein
MLFFELLFAVLNQILKKEMKGKNSRSVAEIWKDSGKTGYLQS